MRFNKSEICLILSEELGKSDMLQQVFNEDLLIQVLSDLKLGIGIDCNI